MIASSQVQSKQDDLLRSSLRFFKAQDKPNSQFKIFELVQAGKITEINDYIQQLQQQGSKDEIEKIVNSRDETGKTPLFYAWNLVMYFLTKDADPYLTNGIGQTVFHILSFMGHLDCAQIVFNHERHKDRKLLLSQVKGTMKQFSNIKKSDVRKGELVCSDKHIPQVQQRFQSFRKNIYDIFNKFLDNWIDKFKKALLTQDEQGRNPIHYASLNNFTTCQKVSQYILLFDINEEGYDKFATLYDEVQLLELNKEKREDTRQYLSAISIVENFLLPEEYNKLVNNFKSNLKRLRKDTINQQDNEGYTPQHVSSFNGDFAGVQFYVKLGGDPSKKCHKNRKQVLDYAENNCVRKYLTDLKDAARKGDKASMELLVNCGHAIDERKTIFGIAPLHNAVEHFHNKQEDQPLRYLIECNADLDIADSNGWTALHHACLYGDLYTVEMLVKAKASVNKFSNKNLYPIHVAAMHNHPEIIEYLLSIEQEFAARIDVLDDQKCTPLLLAAKKGFVESMKSLLDRGANIYQTDFRGWNAMHYAAFNQHKDAVHLLARYDADYEKLKNMKNTKGQTPKLVSNNSEIQFAFHTLWNAAVEGNLDVVRKLKMIGHDINEQTLKKKQTPLMLATIKQHYLIIKYLQESNADENIADQANKTAKDYAYDTENRKIIQLLEHEAVLQ